MYLSNTQESMVRLSVITLLVGLFISTPALALDDPGNGPDDPRIRRSVKQAGKTSFWLTFGGNRYDGIYNDHGDLVEFANGLSVTRLNAHVGASHTVISAPLFEFALGADVGFSRTSSRGSFLDGEVRVDASGSELDAQSALAYGEVRLRYVSARFGYQLDLGAGMFEDTMLPNTDNQDAVFVSVQTTLPVAHFRLFAGFESYVSTPKNAEGRGAENEPITFKYDLGDHILLRAGGGYAFGPAEVGLALLYRYRSNERYTWNGDSFTGDSGRHLSVVPYAVVAAPSFPVEFHARLAFEDEYGDYGFALAGENENVTRTSLTIGAVYAF